jgi:hypothetical protein
MKRYTSKLFIVLSLIIAATCAAHAQPSRRVVVNVPFDFIVGKQSMPAGTYTVRQLNQQGARVLLVERADRSAACLVQANTVEAAKAAGHGRLEFHRYGNNYFLFRVWSAGVSEGRELPPSALERTLARESARAANGADAGGPQTVAVGGRME